MKKILFILLLFSGSVFAQNTIPFRALPDTLVNFSDTVRGDGYVSTNFYVDSLLNTVVGGVWTEDVNGINYVGNVGIGAASLSNRDLYVSGTFGVSSTIYAGSNVNVTGLLQSSSLQASNLNYPTTDGSNGDVITTNGAGTLSLSSLGDLATKDYWAGTQAQYDALGSYDSNTLYFINN